MKHSIRVAQLLNLLRVWGWDAGRERVESHIASLPDPFERALALVFFGFQCVERGDEAQGAELFRAAAAAHPSAGPWGSCGLAFVAMRTTDYDAAIRHLDDAEAAASEDEDELRGLAKHLRAATRYRCGAGFEEVHGLCEQAIAHFGLDGFASGRVLDTLGMLYASQGSYQSAHLFFSKALDIKRKQADLPGQAVTLGNLGRLELTWGNLDAAARHFRDDREISESIGDQRGAAQMFGHLGRVEVLRERWSDAVEWLDFALTTSASRWPSVDGFAFKDRALAHAALGRLDAASADIERAAALLTTPDGKGHVALARGVVRRERGELAESQRDLQSSLSFFESMREPSDAAIAALELVRTRCRMEAPRSFVVQTLRQAFDLAARSRRDWLCLRIEAEMRSFDRLVWTEHLYERVRGRDPGRDTASLVAADRQDATALFLDIAGSTDLGRALDPAAVLATTNELMAHFGAVIENHGMHVSAFLGDGFLALSSGQDHAARAVGAALDLFGAIEVFNRPRRLLRLDPIRIRVGCNSGRMVFGNLGTHRKMDYTAIGHAVNMAKRVEGNGTTERPAVGHGTWELVNESFDALDPAGREATYKGGGIVERRVWDIVGRKAARA